MTEYVMWEREPGAVSTWTLLSWYLQALLYVMTLLTRHAPNELFNISFNVAQNYPFLSASVD